MDVLTRPFTKKENEIKTASPILDAEARVRLTHPVQQKKLILLAFVRNQRLQGIYPS